MIYEFVFDSKISKICQNNVDENAWGRCYMKTYGARKVAKLLGGDYDSLTRSQKEIFRSSCIDMANIGNGIKCWEYYLSI